MKYLGIDYGTKKIGFAISDATGSIAFPYSIVPTNEKDTALETVITKEGIEAIVMGKSTDLKGQSNKVQEDINDFAAGIGVRYGLPIHFVQEFFSSSEARHATKTERGRTKPTANPRHKGKSANGTATQNAHVDAEAAAIILQRHLDTIQLKNK